MENGITVGMDMGDRKHKVCVLDAEGNVKQRASVGNTARAVQKFFGGLPRCRVALEVGTHSGWISRLILSMGHEVLVGNTRKLRVIWDSDQKDDNRDAEMLARIARVDPKLLYPIHHRSAEAHADLAVIKARDMLVKTRTILVAHARGTVKAFGERVSDCSAESFHVRMREELPAALAPALDPVINTVEDLSKRIRDCDRLVEFMCRQRYPETHILRAISGVGPVTALAYVLTIEECSRFEKSRAVGPFLGLVPKRDQSGQIDKQLHITKAGNEYLRRLLVGCAQYILGHFGPDCDLRRYGLKLAERGGKNAKRRAVVAVARKLAVMMHHLWKSGDTYDPFHRQKLNEMKAA